MAVSPNWKQRFLAQLAEFPNVSKACRAAAISHATAYAARKVDAQFAEAWQMCIEQALDDAEEGIFTAGAHDWRAYEAALKAFRPDRWGVKAQLDVTVNVKELAHIIATQHGLTESDALEMADNVEKELRALKASR